MIPALLTSTRHRPVNPAALPAYLPPPPACWAGRGCCVQGERDLRVPQDFLDDLRLLSVEEHQGGEGVPRVAEPYLGQPRTSQQGLERLNGGPMLEGKTSP